MLKKASLSKSLADLRFLALAPCPAFFITLVFFVLSFSTGTTSDASETFNAVNIFSTASLVHASMSAAKRFCEETKMERMKRGKDKERS